MFDLSVYMDNLAYHPSHNEITPFSSADGTALIKNQQGILDYQVEYSEPLNTINHLN